MKLSKILTPANILIGLIVALFLGLLTFLAVSARVDPLRESMEDQGLVGMLFIVHQEGDPLATGALYFHTATGRMALFDVPRETGALVGSLGKMAPLADLFHPGNTTPYKELVEELLGQPIDFVLAYDLDQLEKVVDLVGGVNLFLSEPIEKVDAETAVMIPAGSVHLEGPKVRDYLLWDEGRAVGDRGERYQRFFQALIREFSDQSGWLSVGPGLSFFRDLAAPGHDSEGLGLWLGFLGTSDTENIIFQRILGTTREVEGRQLLFPHFNGNLIREGVQQAMTAIGSEKNEAGLTFEIRLEILNGTTRIGLASRAATVFSGIGIAVVRVANAERSDHARTVVLDRRGNPAAAQRVAQIIRCANIQSDEATLREGGDADVTLILGTDFDGRYVQ